MNFKKSLSISIADGLALHFGCAQAAQCTCSGHGNCAP